MTNDDMIAALTAAGYRVTRPRKRAAAVPDGDTGTCVHCGSTADRITRTGAKKPTARHAVGICSDCYRFGPNLHAVPMVPEDPAAHLRLFRLWRRAHHRFARRYAELGEHAALTRAAENTAGKVKVAMGQTRFVRNPAAMPTGDMGGTR